MQKVWKWKRVFLLHFFFFFQIKPWNHCLNFRDTSPKKTAHVETEGKQTEHSIRKCKQTYLYISI